MGKKKNMGGKKSKKSDSAKNILKEITQTRERKNREREKEKKKKTDRTTTITPDSTTIPPTQNIHHQ